MEPRLLGVHGGNVLLPLADLVIPLRHRPTLDQGQKPCQQLTDGSHQGVVGGNILVYLGGIHIDVENPAVAGKFGGVRDDPVGEACSQGNHQVGLVGARVGGLCPVHTDHAAAQRMPGGKG